MAAKPAAPGWLPASEQNGPYRNTAQQSLSDLEMQENWQLSEGMKSAEAAALLFLRYSGMLGLQTRPATQSSKGLPTAAKRQPKECHAGVDLSA